MRGDAAGVVPAAQSSVSGRSGRLGSAAAGRTRSRVRYTVERPIPNSSASSAVL